MITLLNVINTAPTAGLKFRFLTSITIGKMISLNKTMTKRTSTILSILLCFSIILLLSCEQRSEESTSSNSEKGLGMEHMDHMNSMNETMDDSGHMMMMQDSGRMMMMREEEMKGMRSEMMRDMRVIHSLLRNHEKVQRRVKNIPGGIESWTESEDPKIAETIQTHVVQMKERMEQGEPIRMMDPVFRELFDHRKQIKLNVEKTPKGVHVTETSDDPKVVALIRQHAHQAVSEFAKHGMERAMKLTPLPEGYDYSE